MNVCTACNGTGVAPAEVAPAPEPTCECPRLTWFNPGNGTFSADGRCIRCGRLRPAPSAEEATPDHTSDCVSSPDHDGPCIELVQLCNSKARYMIAGTEWHDYACTLPLGHDEPQHVSDRGGVIPRGLHHAVPASISWTRPNGMVSDV